MSAADRLDEIDSGPGWFEVIHPSHATTHIVYVHEDGSLYFPEGTQVLDRHEFAFADLQGRAYRLVRSDALVAALRAVHQIAFDPDTESALEVGQIRNGPYIEGVSKDEALSYARDALRDIRRAIEEALS